MDEVGFAKVEITCFEPGMALLGWGRPENRALGVRTPLFARAMVVRRGERKVAIVAADLCFVSIALRHGVLAEVARDGFGPHHVLLAATHTHSGPSGFSHFLLYNAPGFGFSKVVFDRLVAGLVAAIREADGRRERAVLRFGAAHIPSSEPVAFNRSPAAYNANRDVERVDPRRPELATDRRTAVLRADALDGRPLGAIDWFGVHASSFHADNRLIDADNKGLAAAGFEAHVGRGFVALFLQGAAGDVTPNFRADPSRGVHVGLGADDEESAARNAEIQVRHALRAYEAAQASPPLAGEIGGLVEHVDLGFATRRAPVLGLAMAAGTEEGPGPLRPVASLLRAAARVKLRDPKLPWLSVGDGARGTFLGAIPTRLGFHLVAPVEPIIRFVKAADDAGWVGGVPWAPRVLPLQVLRLGGLTLGALPFEVSTVAGRRLSSALAVPGQLMQLTSYANGYAGYVVTPEEYATQHYEGSATYFGPQTLQAITRAMRPLALGKPGPTDGRPLGPALELIDEHFLLAQRAIGDRLRAQAIGNARPVTGPAGSPARARGATGSG